MVVKARSVFILIIIFCCAKGASAQQKLSTQYQQRAETMYADIWQHYRVAGEDGLFSENFPSGHKDTLNYFQGAGVAEKRVSFLWPFSGMSSATNVLLKIPQVKRKYRPYLDSLVIGVEHYRDTTRKPTGYQAYPVKFEKADRYYDDNGLVGIDYMEAYFNTKDPVYLKRAKEVFTFIMSGWNNDLGGGITWLEGHNDQKPACSNGMALLVALKIYQGSKESYYLNQGKKFYSWMYSNLRDTTGLYGNDIKPGAKLNRTFYSYNSGSVLEAAVLLYRFTGDKEYFIQAQELAKSAYDHFSKLPHDPRLNLSIDLPWFMTVLFRGYEALYQQDGDYHYIAAMAKDLNFAWQNSRDRYGFITHSWSPLLAEFTKPKWLLDEACIAELYARLSILEKARKN